MLKRTFSTGDAEIGRRWQEEWRLAGCGWRLRRMLRRSGCHRRWCSGWRRRSVALVHAQISRISVLRELVALHPFRPSEAVLAHQRRTAGLGAPAHAAARRDRHWVIPEADGHVNGAEKETHVLGALDFDERPELVHFHAGLVLRVVMQSVRHRCPIVADTATHRYCNLLAPAIFFRRRRWHRRRRNGVASHHTDAAY